MSVRKQVNGPPGRIVDPDAAMSSASSKAAVGSLLTNAVNSPAIFYLWLIAMVTAFGSAGYWHIVYYESLLSTQRQSSIIEYNSTVVFVYAYLRFMMYIITYQLFQAHSPTFRSMPVPVQKEISFGLVGVTSFFLWAPATIYATIQVFATGDRGAFMERMAPYMKCALETHLGDRLIHLVNNWSLRRLVHHVVLTFISLSFLELYPFRCFGTLVFGAINDSVGGRSYDLYLMMARFSRRHAKLSGRFGAPTQGIDHLFVPSSAATMAFMARFTYVYWGSFFFFIPSILSALFFQSFDLSTTWKDNKVANEPTSSGVLNNNAEEYFWKLLNFFLGPIFAMINFSNFRALEVQSRVEYWAKEIFLDD